jgi:hypothetical protein
MSDLRNIQFSRQLAIWLILPLLVLLGNLSSRVPRRVGAERPLDHGARKTPAPCETGIHNATLHSVTWAMLDDDGLAAVMHVMMSTLLDDYGLADAADIPAVPKASRLARITNVFFILASPSDLPRRGNASLPVWFRRQA